MRALWAAPRIPSRVKLGVRAALSEVGDFKEVDPLEAISWGEGTSMEKPSRVGNGNGLFEAGLAVAVTLPLPERGESSAEDGDILKARAMRVAVAVMGKMFAGRISPYPNAL